MCLAFAASPLFAQDGIMDRLDALEKNFNAFAAIQTAMKGRLDNIEKDTAQIKADVAALKVTVTQQPSVKKVFQPAVTDVWGRTVQAAQWVSADAAEPIAAPMADPVDMAWRPVGAGACANGSCSTGQSMRGVGIFRFRR
jgi:hypothetical protein